jgi:hypothetical protein
VWMVRVRYAVATLRSVNRNRRHRVTENISTPPDYQFYRILETVMSKQVSNDVLCHRF